MTHTHTHTTRVCITHTHTHTLYCQTRVRMHLLRGRSWSASCQRSERSSCISMQTLPNSSANTSRCIHMRTHTSWHTSCPTAAQTRAGVHTCVHIQVHIDPDIHCNMCAHIHVYIEAAAWACRHLLCKQKRPTMQAKETYYASKRDLL